ncbi:MAG TPA: LysR family transcriptional regulator [Burkholderiaceae bacterium]
MNLRQIEVVTAILQAGSVSGAAALLGISQPSATRHLRNVESELGYLLFTREGGRVKPTPELRALRPLLRDATETLDKVAQRAISMAGSAPRLFRVGLVRALAGLVPAVYQAARDCCRSATFEFVTCESAALAQAIAARHVDLGLSTEPSHLENLVCHRLATEPLCCVGQARLLGDFGRATSIDMVALDALDAVKIVEKGVLTHFLAPYNRSCRWSPDVVSVDTAGTALEMASRGQGIAVVDGISARAFGGTLTALPLTPSVHMTLQAIVLDRGDAPPVLPELIDALRKPRAFPQRGMPELAGARR